jgi:hypothetical protein
VTLCPHQQLNSPGRSPDVLTDVCYSFKIKTVRYQSHPLCCVPLSKQGLREFGTAVLLAKTAAHFYFHIGTVLNTCCFSILAEVSACKLPGLPSTTILHEEGFSFVSPSWCLHSVQSKVSVWVLSSCVHVFAWSSILHPLRLVTVPSSSLPATALHFPTASPHARAATNCSHSLHSLVFSPTTAFHVTSSSQTRHWVPLCSPFRAAGHRQRH